MPSGASTGTREALELRDGDKRRYGGKGVLKAVGHVNGEIATALAGADADQRAVDARLIALDGTPNLGRLGANAVLGVSMAVARAAAAARRACRSTSTSRRSCPPAARAGGPLLPVPMMNILNGGAHADTNVDFQEFMVDAASACRRSPRRCAPAPRRFTRCAALLKKRGLATGVGDEGGFAPSLSSNREAVELVLEAVARRRLPARAATCSSRSTSRRASSGTTTPKHYVLKKSGEGTKSRDEMIALYEDWTRQYPIISIEDGLAEGDWPGWTAADAALGDARAARRRRRLRDQPGDPAPRASTRRSATRCSSSSTRSARSARRSPRSRWRGRPATRSVISHRSGETEDTTIADLAVATCAGQIKTGSASRSDRTAKYNQLLRIEAALGAARARRLRRARAAVAISIAAELRRRPPMYQASFCFVTAKAPGTRRTGSPAGPTSI